MSRAARHYYLGIDIGSAFSKAVVIEKGEPVSYEIMPSGGNYGKAANEVVSSTLEKAGISPGDIYGAVATGYGGTSVMLPNRAFTDISCISRGVFQDFPTAHTVVDIGSQYSRVIRLDEHGRNTSFLLSERCAGGSGRFLQTIAHVLGISLEEIGPTSLRSANPVRFNTGCAVFAETEAISRIAEGASVEDILAGVHAALASRIQILVERIGLEEDIVVTGGGAKDTGLVHSLQELLGMKVRIPREPHITTALGAALLAADTSVIR
ncbi:MAG: hypothetical protein JW712_05050 [Dehalococcoidales bacterium]|nr:hypothetical protein [Dehalococcoidales bacterium]